MRPGTIVVLNGTSSSGKTTLLRALQNRLAEPFVDAGLDRFLWMLPPRYLERPLWDDVLGLADRAGETGHALISGMHSAIAALARRGNNVLADHVLVEASWAAECARLFYELPAYLVGVHCPLDVLERREAVRKDRTLGQARKQFPLVHAHGLYDLSVDTARYGPDECAAMVDAFLRSGTPPRAFAALYERKYGVSGDGAPV